jgi:hypothetical protein
MAQRFATRADHDKKEYSVYETETGNAVRTFKYRREMDRGIAHGRANMVRDAMNRNGTTSLLAAGQVRR